MFLRPDAKKKKQFMKEGKDNDVMTTMKVQWMKWVNAFYEMFYVNQEEFHFSFFAFWHKYFTCDKRNINVKYLCNVKKGEKIT